MYTSITLIVEFTWNDEMCRTRFPLFTCIISWYDMFFFLKCKSRSCSVQRWNQARGSVDMACCPFDKGYDRIHWAGSHVNGLAHEIPPLHKIKFKFQTQVCIIIVMYVYVCVSVCLYNWMIFGIWSLTVQFTRYYFNELGYWHGYTPLAFHVARHLWLRGACLPPHGTQPSALLVFPAYDYVQEYSEFFFIYMRILRPRICLPPIPQDSVCLNLNLWEGINPCKGGDIVGHDLSSINPDSRRVNFDLWVALPIAESTVSESCCFKHTHRFSPHRRSTCTQWVHSWMTVVWVRGLECRRRTPMARPNKPHPCLQTAPTTSLTRCDPCPTRRKSTRPILFFHLDLVCIAYLSPVPPWAPFHNH